jgi:hypothetical protein
LINDKTKALESVELHKKKIIELESMVEKLKNENKE